VREGEPLLLLLPLGVLRYTLAVGGTLYEREEVPLESRVELAMADFVLEVLVLSDKLALALLESTEVAVCASGEGVKEGEASRFKATGSFLRLPNRFSQLDCRFLPDELTMVF
jgi:hypothetical protein